MGLCCCEQPLCTVTDFSLLPKNQPAQQGRAVSQFRVSLSRNSLKLCNRIEIFVTVHTKFRQWTSFWSGQLFYISGCHFRRKPQNTLINFGFRVRVWVRGSVIYRRSVFCSCCHCHLNIWVTPLCCLCDCGIRILFYLSDDWVCAGCTLLCSGVGLYIEQHRHCTYNVTLWRCCVTIVAVETKQCLLSILLSYRPLSTVALKFVYFEFMSTELLKHA